MSAPDHDRVSALFLEACELPPDERPAFLDRVCSGRPDLRAEVESLLAHDDAVPEILQTGVLASHTVSEIDRPPERIGAYQVREKLGEGGMGVVYRAVQKKPMRREVAIKLIKVGIETREVIARFESERQALALMSHANIARVFDAGATKTGRPYFVMEYVEGAPITRYCDERRASLGERIELFLQVCDGVQHAHYKAIIHRDIKPSNVLVSVEDGRPVPKIIDFGVAKATDHRLSEHTLYTDQGRLMGTPEYMSPEQAASNGYHVDTRTDVYSLGALLYELLTGAQPHERERLGRSSLEEIRRVLCEDEPVRPSQRVPRLDDPEGVARRRSTDTRTLVRRLRGDLDVIAGKALEKDAARRYASPSELALDLRRHASHEPVLASPPGRFYRLGKFARKHRAGVVFASSLLVLLTGFAVTMTFQSARTARERDRANLEAATTEQVLDFLVGLFELSDPNEARGNSITAREILDRSVGKIEHELAGQPLVQARLMSTTGKVYRNLGLDDEALPLLERAQARLASLLGPDHPETLKTMKDLAFLHFYQGRLEHAERLHVETMRRMRLALGDEHDLTLNTMKNLANLYTAQRRFAEAEALHLEALGKMRSTLGEEHTLTLRAMRDLGVLYRESGRFDEAEPLMVAALDAQRRVLGEDHPTTLSSMTSLGVLYMHQGRWERADSLYLEALEGKRQVLGERHPSTLKTLYNMACLAALSGRSEDAVALLRRAVDLGYAREVLFDDPDLDSLRGDPRFETIVAEVRRHLGGG